MLVIVGCEESQAICKAFRERGHEAYSCDIQPCSGFRPEWHLQMDVFKAIASRKWDQMIANPECRYLCWSGERWVKSQPGRMQKRMDALDFFKRLYDAPIDRVAIENSFSWFLRRNFRWEDQLVHPFNFGSPYRKSICLWKRGLPDLVPTSDLTDGKSLVHSMWPCADRSKIRSKTDPLVADAIAEQWG